MKTKKKKNMYMFAFTTKKKTFTQMQIFILGAECAFLPPLLIFYAPNVRIGILALLLHNVLLFYSQLSRDFFLF